MGALPKAPPAATAHQDRFNSNGMPLLEEPSHHGTSKSAWPHREDPERLTKMCNSGTASSLWWWQGRRGRQPHLGTPATNGAGTDTKSAADAITQTLRPASHAQLVNSGCESLQHAAAEAQERLQGITMRVGTVATQALPTGSQIQLGSQHNHPHWPM